MRQAATLALRPPRRPPPGDAARLAGDRGSNRSGAGRDQEQPLVEPQVAHFMQVPLRTSVKLPHSPQASPS